MVGKIFTDILNPFVIVWLILFYIYLRTVFRPVLYSLSPCVDFKIFAVLVLGITFLLQIAQTQAKMGSLR